MKDRVLPLLISTFLAFPGLALGYEISTHALIADHAYRASVLNPENTRAIAPVLGFDRLAEDLPFSFHGQPDNVPYRDEAALPSPSETLPQVGGNFSRFKQAQEGEVLEALVAAELLPGESASAVEQKLRSWLLRGAVREDDNDFRFPGAGWTNSDHRDPDPFGFIMRATKHFYDPIHDRPFDHGPACLDYGCVKSIHWALGRSDPLNPAADSDFVARRNHFTWQDARNNYWWSLLLKRDNLENGYDFADAMQDGYERSQRWATTIKNVGHVLHLLQDAGQPQHVRNDGHAPPLGASGEEEVDAAFEAFTNYRVLGNRAAALGLKKEGNPLRRMRDDTLPSENSLAAIRLGQSNYYPGGGGRVQFSTPVKFFTTRHIETGTDEASLRSRRGLADLSNRSFFTAGTMPGFRECQPPGVSGCVPAPAPTYPLPPSDLEAAGFTQVAVPSGLRVHGRVVHLSELAFPITDAVAPNYDQSANTLAAYGGKAPLLTKGVWHDIIPDDLAPEFLASTGYLLSYNTMRYTADVMIPRAVGYSAGLIDHFFRGRLEVTPIDQDVFAVMNAGDPHTVDPFGYPRKYLAETEIFGFDKVRLKVRNATETIVESGTGTAVAQATGGPGSRLVAIARYHRNTCYKPDFSGERVKDFDGTRLEPVCGDQTVRYPMQEISVSAPLGVAAGELDTATPIEKLFDFSADPIPINATDLFIQVAYRGKLGDEPDGIAVGIHDVSEPTFIAFWNNTDYAWNGTNYVPANPSYPIRSVYSFYACAGFPSKLMYRYAGSPGTSAMLLPPPPGAVRLAMIFGRPDNATQRFPVRAVPIMISAPHAPVRSAFTRGQQRQASRENVAASVLAAPYENCFVTPPPAGVDSWCFDPIQRRRGQRFGEIAQPLYWSLGAADGPDVDSVPLPAVGSPIIRDGGEIRFNDAGALQNCPPQPTLGPEEIRAIDAREAAELLGEA